MTAVPTPREAATVVVVRQGGAGPEVLLLQRAERGDHNSGAWVFPGGLLDPGDRIVGPEPTALSDARASAELGLPSGGLAFRMAAIRECFEESGILFALDASGGLANLDTSAGAALTALRDQVKSGATSLVQICTRFQLRLAPERLHYIGHWITPVGRAKRFDTRFFLAIAPPGQTALHDAGETLDHVWLSPEEALSPRNARRLMTPTRAMLELVRPFDTTDALAAWAASPRQVPCVLPRLALDASGLRPVQPEEAAWAEIGKLDPEGRCDTWCVLRPDMPVRLSPHVLRVPCAATGHNSYLVGDDGSGWMAIDPAGAAEARPGAQLDAHLQALQAAATGGLRRIVLTRAAAAPTSAASLLQAQSGAEIVAARAGHPAWPIAVGPVELLLRSTHAASVGLLPQDRMVFAPDASVLDAASRLAADWLAPASGFLQALPRPA